MYFKFSFKNSKIKKIINNLQKINKSYDVLGYKIRVEWVCKGISYAVLFFPKTFD